MSRFKIIGPKISFKDKLRLILIEMEVLFKTFNKINLEYVHRNGRIFSIVLGKGPLKTISPEVFNVIRKSWLFKGMRHKRVRHLIDFPESDPRECASQCIVDPEWDYFIDYIGHQEVKKHEERKKYFEEKEND